jgi:hypothetical protein
LAALTPLGEKKKKKKKKKNLWETKLEETSKAEEVTFPSCLALWPSCILPLLASWPLTSLPWPLTGLPSYRSPLSVSGCGHHLLVSGSCTASDQPRGRGFQARGRGG